MNVITGQTPFDLCIQELGSLEFLADFIALNNITDFDSMPATVDSGNLPKNIEVTSYFSAHNIKISGEIIIPDVIVPPVGIGTAQIGSTFKIS